ncbi:MFS transporter, partial [Pseudomonas sp. 32_A]
VSTVTLLGSALATIAVGMLAGRVAHRRMLMLAATLMAATGIGFASLSTLWALIAVAFVGTLNPSAGDVSLFLPLEQSRLAEAAAGDARTALFARYSLIGALSAAAGSLAAGLPLWLAAHTSIPLPGAMRGMFVVYAGAGVAVWLLYRHLPLPEAHAPAAPPPLGPSRRIVTRLAMLFSVDAFAGGLVVNSLLSLWLMQRFGLSVAAAGRFFF